MHAPSATQGHGLKKKSSSAIGSWKALWKSFQNPLRPEDIREAARMEKNVGLPVKAVVIGLLFYFLYLSDWYADVTLPAHSAMEPTLAMVRVFFLVYVSLNMIGAGILIWMNNFTVQFIYRTASILSYLDVLFVSAMITVTEGFDSNLYWWAAALVVRNSFTTMTAERQLSTNLLLTLCFVLAGMHAIHVIELEKELLDALSPAGAEPTETKLLPVPDSQLIVLRILLLLLLSLWTYGMHVLFVKQHRAEEESRERIAREEQLQATGRMAAEIAHQLKNPLSIINNAAFNLQQDLAKDQLSGDQIQIIREEVDRSDQILTELMGYARLAEGRIDKLDVPNEIDRALDMVFPPAAGYPVRIERQYAAGLPPLLIEQGHLTQVLVNILQNAREAMKDGGTIQISADMTEEGLLEVRIRDSGPGISMELSGQIFEAYFSTKKKGTGLGLAIARQNTELYHGTVTMDSELGKGAEFRLRFPPRITRDKNS